MKKLRSVKLASQSLLFCIVLAACNNTNNPTAGYRPEFAADTSKQNIIVLGYPNFSYSETGALLTQYLNAHLRGSKIIVHACVNWDEYVSLLHQGKLDMGLTNGILATEATNYGYSIFAKITSDEPYSSVIVTRKKSGISKPTDLKAKKVALVPSNIIPSTMMGLYYLYQGGLDVNLNIHKVNVASFEAGILSVYLGKSDAAICPKRNWNVYVRDHPEILSKVEIKWETPALQHNAVLIKNTVDKKIISELIGLLFSIRNTKEGMAALQRLDITGFEKANNDTYKPSLDFKKKYDAVIF